MQQFNVIGLMSGSSLDGVDLCYAEFFIEDDRWNYKNCIAETITYSKDWSDRLKKTGTDTAENFCKCHVQYGRYLGSLIKSFIKKNDLLVQLISSHGHTIFHQPKNNFTTQIGDGASIYATTGIKTISDLRSVDVAFGGQGAPLVPIGERDLFGDYGMFLNLGGIANITVFDKNKSVIAYDISPCNMVLNMLCERYFNIAFDKHGEISSRGKINSSLFDDLSQLSYFSESVPKSLGREFTLQEYLPVIERYEISPEDKLYTALQHITTELSKAINKSSSLSRKPNIMVSGGGVYNKFLMLLLEQKCDVEIIVPSSMLIEFKEALIFAYLGVLRLTGNVNSLASVTNASRDSIGGAIWG